MSSEQLFVTILCHLPDSLTLVMSSILEGKAFSIKNPSKQLPLSATYDISGLPVSSSHTTPDGTWDPQTWLSHQGVMLTLSGEMWTSVYFRWDPRTNQKMILLKFNLENQWVYWTCLQSMGDGSQIGMWVTLRQRHLLKVLPHPAWGLHRAPLSDSLPLPLYPTLFLIHLQCGERQEESS